MRTPYLSYANSVDRRRVLWRLIWVCTVCQCPFAQKGWCTMPNHFLLYVVVWPLYGCIRHFVERHFVYWTISSKNLFVEVSFRRMSTSSKHVSSNTFDEIFYAHPTAIIYLLVMWPRILSIANSVLFRGNISRSDLNNSFYPGIYAPNFSCLVYGVCPAMNCSIQVCFYKILGSNSHPF